MSVFIAGACASLISAAAWALSMVLYERLEEKITPFSLNLTRGILSVLLLSLATWFVAAFDFPGFKTLLMLGASGLLGIALGDSFFFLALRCLGARVTSLLGTLAPLITMFLAIIFLGEKITVFDSFGICLTLTGVAWVLWERNTSHENKIGDLWRGIGYGLLSLLCMSVSVILAKASMAGISTLEATLIRMTAGVFGLIVWGLKNRSLSRALRPLFVFSFLKKLILIVLVSTLGGFWLFMVSLKYIDASIASTLNCTTPLFVLPLAAFFFKERISSKVLAGVALAVCGAAMIIAL